MTIITVSILSGMPPGGFGLCSLLYVPWLAGPAWRSADCEDKIHTFPDLCLTPDFEWPNADFVGLFDLPAPDFVEPFAPPTRGAKPASAP